MVVLGLILVVAAVLAGVGVGVSSSSSASIEGFGVELETTAAVVYFAGAATAIVLVAGLWMMKKGTARTYRRRQEVKALRQQVVTDVARHDARSEDVPPPQERPGSAPAEDEPADGERPATTR
jgi:uncharacterized membrane protein YciS (DUF1049 family)